MVLTNLLCDFVHLAYQINISQKARSQVTHISSQLLDDTVGSVRDVAAGALGTAMKVVGEKFMSEYINDLDNIKKQKVNQLAL